MNTTGKLHEQNGDTSREPTELDEVKRLEDEMAAREAALAPSRWWSTPIFVLAVIAVGAGGGLAGFYESAMPKLLLMVVGCVAAICILAAAYYIDLMDWRHVLVLGVLIVSCVSGRALHAVMNGYDQGFIGLLYSSFGL